MQRRRALVPAAALAAAAALVLPACSQEQADLLDQAFKKDIKSAYVSLSIDGRDDQQQELHLSLSGAYRSNGPGRLESFDWTVSAAGLNDVLWLDGTRVTSTGRNVFVRLGGATYEVGERAVARLNRQQAAQEDQQIDSLADAEQAGLDLRSWFPRSDTEDDAEVGDEPTTRVTGVVDLSAALKDLRDFARGRGAAVPELRPLRQLSDRDIEKADAVMRDPRFAVDIAKSDGKVRRVAVQTRLVDGKDRATFRLVLQLRHVDQPVHIDAPKHGRPFRQLLRRLDGGHRARPGVGDAVSPDQVS